MNDRLAAETKNLIQSWARHQPEMLRDYLVSGVEDPRLNLQSILTRHFLARGFLAAPPQQLMQQECVFSAAMNQLLHLRPSLATVEDAALLLHALRSGADNFEGTPVPALFSRLFRQLPCVSEGGPVPNYLEQFLATFDPVRSWDFAGPDSCLSLFIGLWLPVITRQLPAARSNLSVLEAACGSANDYRWLRACGLSQGFDYHGFDLCEANITNARAMFPDAHFAVGNVFQIPAGAQQFDFSFTHDLFEHLSPEGIATAAAELCRVTRRGLSVGFFNMDDLPEHVIEPYENYHWNTLSARQMQALFARHGFHAQMIHIGTLFRAQTGCDAAHNPRAWTFWLERAPAP